MWPQGIYMTAAFKASLSTSYMCHKREEHLFTESQCTCISCFMFTSIAKVLAILQVIRMTTQLYQLQQSMEHYNPAKLPLQFTYNLDIPFQFQHDFLTRIILMLRVTDSDLVSKPVWGQDQYSDSNTCLPQKNINTPE